MIVGYARVSTDGQTLDAQDAALKAAGAQKAFAEKVSGAQTDRKQLANAIAALSAGEAGWINQGPPERLGDGV
jgi:DNA invertase Pin-like site-specific DNA recombinase